MRWRNFAVITNNGFSAEYGRVGGGIVNASLRSGTNQFHGTVYEFLRNTDLNATGYFRAQTNPTLHRNQFGATIGGPIIKDRFFFFVDYEGYRQKQGYFNPYSVPDLNDRTGILPVTVVNPLTGAVYPANTQIPASAITPFAQAALAGLQTPNFGNPATNRSNNLQDIVPIKDYSDKFDARLDYQINSKMTSFLRFSQRKDIAYYGPADPGISGGDGNGFIHAIQQQAAIGYTWTISPSSLIEGRFGFDHVLGGKEPPYLGGPDIASQFNIPGLPSSLAGGFPTQAIGSFSNPTIGRQATNPQFQNPTSFNPKFNYSLVKGRHSIKAGYEFLAIRTEVLDINPLYGQDTYSGQFSKPNVAQCPTCPASTDSNSFDLADFYFGLPSAIALGSNLTTNLRQHVNSLYVQDDWHATSKLTVNIGLRWEFATARMGSRQLLVELRSRDQYPGAGDERQPLQSRPGESGLQGLRTAYRHGLQLRPEDFDPRRLRNQLRLLQSAGKRGRRNQRPARGFRNVNPIVLRRWSGSRRFPDDPEQLYDGTGEQL